MKKTFLTKVENKIFKNKVVKFVNQKGHQVNNFINDIMKGGDWNMNIKSHTMTKKFTPFEEKILEQTA